MIIPTLMCRAGKGKSALFEQTRQSLAAGIPRIVADSASPGSDKLPYMFTITINMVTININMITINMFTISSRQTLAAQAKLAKLTLAAQAQSSCPIQTPVAQASCPKLKAQKLPLSQLPPLPPSHLQPGWWLLFLSKERVLGGNNWFSSSFDDLMKIQQIKKTNYSD